MNNLSYSLDNTSLKEICNERTINNERKENSGDINVIKLDVDPESVNSQNINCFEDAASQVIKLKREKSSYKMTYECLMWVIFISMTIFVVVERFVGHGDNLLRRNGRAMHRLRGHYLGDMITNYIWAATGRLLLIAQNMMFFTVLWCIPNTMSESFPRFVRVKGILDVHKKAHRICGIFLIGIPAVAHVLICFLPPIVDGTKLIYHPPSSFNMSNQLWHLNWTKFWDPARVEGLSIMDKEGVHMTADEVYRLVLMVFIFMIMIPLTRSSYLNKRSYSLAITLHLIAGVWYGVDNIRKISHALAQIFNLPVLILWMIDRILSMVWYRSSRAKIVKRTSISNNQYLDIRVKLNNFYERGIGDVYYLLEENAPCSMERSHPFTSYSNHSKDASWDIGFIIAVVRAKHQWAPAWSRRICRNTALNEKTTLKCWGPYRSSVQDLYKQLQLGEKSSYLLLASGSGFGYLLDTLGVLAYKVDLKNKVNMNIHFSVRGDGFKKKYAHEIEDLLEKVKRNSKICITFKWHSTSIESYNDVQEESFVQHTNNRMDFEKILRTTTEDTLVYFVGRPSVADAIAPICKKSKLDFTKDAVNGQRGVSDKALIVKYLKLVFYITASTVLFCLIVGIYSKNR